MGEEIGSDQLWYKELAQLPKPAELSVYSTIPFYFKAR